MSAIHCFFCGGKECKYENWTLWTPEKYPGKNAFDGLFSSWISENILAMQRPSTRIIKEYNVIQKFTESRIFAVFNLQQFGEHASCGDGIIPESGFSYSPEIFMDNGVPECQQTRPLSIQTKKQQLFVSRFEEYLKTLRLFFPRYLSKSQREPLPAPVKELSLGQSIANQRKLLRENETEFKNVPKVKFKIYKIVHIIITRLIDICTGTEKWYSTLGTFVEFEGYSALTPKIISMMADINENDWGEIVMELDEVFLVEFLLQWIIKLDEPLIDINQLVEFESEEEQVEKCDKAAFHTLNFMLQFFRQIPSISKSTIDVVFQRFCMYTSSERRNLRHMNTLDPKPATPAESPTKTNLNNAKIAADNLAKKMQAPLSNLNSNLTSLNTKILANTESLMQNLRNRNLMYMYPQRQEKRDEFPPDIYLGTMSDPGQRISIPKLSDNGKKASPILEQPEPRHGDKNPVQNYQNFINHLYKNYNVLHGHTVSMKTKEPVYQTWQTPIEFVKENPRYTENLALKLAGIEPARKLTIAEMATGYIDPLKKTMEKFKVGAVSSPDLPAANKADHQRTASHTVDTKKLPKLDESLISLSTSPQFSMVWAAGSPDIPLPPLPTELSKS
ncbi:Protein tyrosine phosphatase domain-containing protein 1 [Terramyces sp. JEL0728]|nr:Protein tyrosine phosphatase domain-containing protein 1 [Terramyces sp. JEL0728]